MKTYTLDLEHTLPSPSYWEYVHKDGVFYVESHLEMLGYDPHTDSNVGRITYTTNVSLYVDNLGDLGWLHNGRGATNLAINIIEHILRLNKFTGEVVRPKIHWAYECTGECYQVSVDLFKEFELEVIVRPHDIFELPIHTAQEWVATKLEQRGITL